MQLLQNIILGLLQKIKHILIMKIKCTAVHIRKIRELAYGNILDLLLLHECGQGLF